MQQVEAAVVFAEVLKKGSIHVRVCFDRPSVLLARPRRRLAEVQRDGASIDDITLPLPDHTGCCTLLPFPRP